MMNTGSHEFPFPQIAAFLQKIAPFDTLPSDELIRIVSRMEIAYAPRGEIIMAQGGPAADFLYIINVGSVRITMSGDTGEELLADIRGEGDHFGDASILQGTQSFAEITALEDTILYLLPADAFKWLVDTYPAFERTFRFPLAKYIKEACESTNRLLSQPDASRTINLESFLIGKISGRLDDKEYPHLHPGHVNSMRSQENDRKTSQFHRHPGRYRNAFWNPDEQGPSVKSRGARSLCG